MKKHKCLDRQIVHDETTEDDFLVLVTKGEDALDHATAVRNSILERMRDILEARSESEGREESS